VKKIVTAIERGNLTDEIPEDEDVDVFQRDKCGPEQNEGRKTGSSCTISPNNESSMDKLVEQETPRCSTGFYIGDTKSPPPSIIMTWCGVANSNNNNASQQECSQLLTPIKESPSGVRPPPYSPDFLHVIEKVIVFNCC